MLKNEIYVNPKKCPDPKDEVHEREVDIFETLQAFFKARPKQALAHDEEGIAIPPPLPFVLPAVVLEPGALSQQNKPKPAGGSGGAGPVANSPAPSASNS